MQTRAPNHDTKRKQPEALPYLFLTEMWERFGFYTVQGLLVLYITEFYGFTDKRAFVISGMFAGLVYISSIIGGYIADRFLGFKTTIIWGGFFLIIGYAALALTTHLTFFYLSLATIIIGNGLLKPNISSLLGTQYERFAKATERDAGFTIFYMGINIGVMLSGLSGYIRHYFGWHVAYACASVGMIIGMITFITNLKHMKTTQTSKKHYTFVLLPLLILGIVCISLLFDLISDAEWILPSAGVVLALYLIFLTIKQPVDRRGNMLLLITLIAFSIIFWMLFYQMFIAANLFVERLVDKKIGGITLSSTVFYASESVFVIITAPFFAWLWQAMARHNKNPSITTKFAYALLALALGFLVLSFSTTFASLDGLINPLWVFFAYFLITVGEMLLSPIGLAAVTLLAPQDLEGFMMGTWFVAIGFGGIFAGMIAKLAAIPDQMQINADKLAIYHDAFLEYAYIGIATSLLLFLVSLALRIKQRL